MSDAKGGGGIKNDIWWFLGILLLLFIFWVALGGPERARKQEQSLFLHGPVGSSRTSPSVQSSSPTSSSTTQTTTTSSTTHTTTPNAGQSGQIHVTPLP